MHRTFLILIMGFFSSLFGCNKSPENSNHNPSIEPKTLEEKLEVLVSCGIALRPDLSIDELLSSWDRAEYEKPGFSMTLVGVGMTQEAPPWKPRSENLWHFDTECIDGHGAYADIAKRMAELSGGSLNLTNIKDYVNIKEGKAWLSFKLDGKTIKIDCTIDNDWVDPKVFGHFVRLLANKDPSKIYFYYDLEGQDCIIGCVNHENYQKLRKIIPKMKLLE